MQTHAEASLPTSQPPVQPSLQPPPPLEPERRVTLYGVSWETYEHLLTDLADCSVPRMTFDQGVLEIMSPTAEHEEYKHMLALLVEMVAVELNINLRGLGSTTFKRPDLQKGFEPDSCFYIQSAPRIRGKRHIDLPQDPPPDLLIEIDMTSSSINRFALFAEVGVPEVWRHDGSRVQIFALVGKEYVEVEKSIAFPLLTNEVITQFVEDGVELERLEWLRRLRDWVRQQVEKESPSR
jgi:Uma2 family endonuclease